MPMLKNRRAGHDPFYFAPNHAQLRSAVKPEEFRYRRKYPLWMRVSIAVVWLLLIAFLWKILQG